jgi:hypothetical protein
MMPDYSASRAAELKRVLKVVGDASASGAGRAARRQAARQAAKSLQGLEGLDGIEGIDAKAPGANGMPPVESLDAMTDREILVAVAVEVGSHSTRLVALEGKLKASAIALAVAVAVASTVIPDLSTLIDLVQVALN